MIPVARQLAPVLLPPGAGPPPGPAAARVPAGARTRRCPRPGCCLCPGRCLRGRCPGAGRRRGRWLAWAGRGGEHLGLDPVERLVEDHPQIGQRVLADRLGMPGGRPQVARRTAWPAAPGHGSCGRGSARARPATPAGAAGPARAACPPRPVTPAAAACHGRRGGGPLRLQAHPRPARPAPRRRPPHPRRLPVRPWPRFPPRGRPASCRADRPAPRPGRASPPARGRVLLMSRAADASSSRRLLTVSRTSSETSRAISRTEAVISSSSSARSSRRRAVLPGPCR